MPHLEGEDTMLSEENELQPLTQAKNRGFLDEETVITTTGARKYRTIVKIVLISAMACLGMLAVLKASTSRTFSAGFLKSEDFQIKAEEDADLSRYCHPSQYCWPTHAQLAALNTSLAGKLHVVSTTPKQGTKQCGLHCGDGVYRNTAMNTMLPALSVHATSPSDVSLAVKFAANHNIRVIVKNLGHSYRGESAGRGALMIFTRGFDKIIIKDKYNSCGATYPALDVGGGVTWGEVYTRLLPTNYSTVGGTCESVSATGGWLQGQGLSTQVGRVHGFGVDNVLDFDIVLPNGTLAHASKCSNPDLFKVLRGGGGGAWGVITSVHYKLLPHYWYSFVQFKLPTLVGAKDMMRIVAKHAVTMDKRLQIMVLRSPSFKSLGTSELTFGFLGQLKDFNKTAFYKDVKALYKKQWFADWYEAETGLLHFKLMTKIDAFHNLRNLGFKGVRIIPRSLFDNTEAAADFLYDHAYVYTAGAFYHLGGAMFDHYQADPNATFVHKNLRTGVFAIDVPSEEANNAWLQRGADWTGTSINHAYWDEPNWQDNQWGHDNYKQLLKFKMTIDPKMLFYCRRCVGWQG